MATNAPGRLLAGRYRLERRIGSGGMGAVHLARDERLGRSVAIKRLPADSPEDAARRFDREARLGASLNHPNLVTIYDTDADEDGVLIVMEYVAGTTLAGELARGPLVPKRALEVLDGVAAGLDHAHDAGVVHRDVKPANVLLGSDGDSVKLADLGIATAAEQSDITRTGTVLGTPSYMAPEQLEGRPIGPAVDVYALATMAFEALSGRKAREGRTPIEIAAKVTSEAPPDLREVWEHAPSGAAEALCRGMDQDPDRRPRSAGDLVEELRAGLEAPRTAATVAAPRTAATRRVPPAAAAAGAGAGAAAPRREPTSERTLYGSRRSGAPRWVVPAVMAAAVAVLLIGLLSLAFGGEDEGSSRSERGGSSSSTRERSTTEEAPAPAPAAEEPPAEEAPAEEAPEPALGGGNDPAEGSRLNDQGFALIQQGDYEGAVPILRRSVSSFPEDSQEQNYAFALFNLGQSLNRSGSSEEAIPYLEKRLEISNFKRGVVQAELARAREQAGQ